MFEKSGSHRSASVTNHSGLVKLLSAKEANERLIPYRILILLVTVECRIIPVGELTTCI